MDVLLNVIRKHHVYKTIRNVFVGEVLMCKQESQIKAAVFV